MDDTPHRAALGERIGHAVGILMALVPCTAVNAHRILDNATRAGGVTPDATARMVITLHHRSTCAAAGRTAATAQRPHSATAEPVNEPVPQGQGRTDRCRT